MTDFAIPQDASNQNKGLIASRIIGILSADNNIKTYYIEYSNGWTNDTLYVDYSPNTPATNCLYVLNRVKYNGKTCAVDDSFHLDLPVYILNKS